MKPMFFGDSSRKLYGVYDAPSGPTRRSSAVLLCYPGVQEYGTSHWAFRRLAAMLARDGHHVLRFDYYGTGDSAGQVELGSIGMWLEDIRHAALELLDLSAARKLSVVGKRLGASLAVKACEGAVEAQRLVLWDPVISGRAYLQELETWDARRNLLLLHPKPRASQPRAELLGYPCSAEQRADIERVNLLTAPAPRVKKVSIFASDPQPAYRQLLDKYREQGLAGELHAESDAERSGTREIEAQGRAQLSGTVLSDIASELRAEVMAA